MSTEALDISNTHRRLVSMTVVTAGHSLGRGDRDFMLRLETLHVEQIHICFLNELFIFYFRITRSSRYYMGTVLSRFRVLSTLDDINARLI